MGTDGYTLLTDNHGEIKQAERYTTVGSGVGEFSGPFSVAEQGEHLEKLKKWHEERFQRSLDLSIRLTPHAKIFLHPDPLVTFCKQNGVMLHCVPRGEFTVGGTIYPRTNALVPLNATWASAGAESRRSVLAKQRVALGVFHRCSPARPRLLFMEHTGAASPLLTSAERTPAQEDELVSHDGNLGAIVGVRFDKKGRVDLTWW